MENKKSVGCHTTDGKKGQTEAPEQVIIIKPGTVIVNEPPKEQTK